MSKEYKTATSNALQGQALQQQIPLLVKAIMTNLIRGLKEESARVLKVEYLAKNSSKKPEELDEKEQGECELSDKEKKKIKDKIPAILKKTKKYGGIEKAVEVAVKSWCGANQIGNKTRGNFDALINHGLDVVSRAIVASGAIVNGKSITGAPKLITDKTKIDAPGIVKALNKAHEAEQKKQDDESPSTSVEGASSKPVVDKTEVAKTT